MALVSNGVESVSFLESNTHVPTYLPTYTYLQATFIPRKGAPENAPEDFGYLATFVINGRDHVTELVILNAQKVSKGPVCRIPLKGFVPHTLHG